MASSRKHPGKPSPARPASSTSFPGARRFTTRERRSWDETNLYVGFWIEEPHVRGNLTDHDASIWQDNDVEVFIAGKDSYFEFEINALGTIYDSFLIWEEAYDDGGFAEVPDFRRTHPGIKRVNGVGFKTHPRGTRLRARHWSFPGLQAAVHIDGTLNDDRDRDRGWSVEVVFPWEGTQWLAKTDGRSLPPKGGDVWRIDFSRFNQYKESPPARDSGGWAWSPHGIWDSHIPECFPYIHFSSSTTCGFPVLSASRRALMLQRFAVLGSAPRFSSSSIAATRPCRAAMSRGVSRVSSRASSWSGSPSSIPVMRVGASQGRRCLNGDHSSPIDESFRRLPAPVLHGLFQRRAVALEAAALDQRIVLVQQLLDQIGPPRHGRGEHIVFGAVLEEKAHLVGLGCVRVGVLDGAVERRFGRGRAVGISAVVQQHTQDVEVTLPGGQDHGRRHPLVAVVPHGINVGAVIDENLCQRRQRRIPPTLYGGPVQRRVALAVSGIGRCPDFGEQVGDPLVYQRGFRFENLPHPLDIVGPDCLEVGRHPVWDPDWNLTAPHHVRLESLPVVEAVFAGDGELGVVQGEAGVLDLGVGGVGEFGHRRP